MPKQEGLIQHQIIEALKRYFEQAIDNSIIPKGRIHLSVPSTGAQAKTADDFGRKPYDIGFYVEQTTVLFLEIKELTVLDPVSGKPRQGKFEAYNNKQQRMLEVVGTNGVDIRYAYNTWTLDRKVHVTSELVLDQAHIRAASNMKNTIQFDPVHPDAETLRAYLDFLVLNSGGATKLVNILDSDVSHFDYLNGMPLMILMNLDKSQTEVLIALEPKRSLEVMKELFKLPKSDRDAKRANLAAAKNYGDEMVKLADRIFEMKDAWDVSKKKKLRLS